MSSNSRLGDIFNALLIYFRLVIIHCYVSSNRILKAFLKLCKVFLLYVISWSCRKIRVGLESILPTFIAFLLFIPHRHKAEGVLLWACLLVRCSVNTSVFSHYRQHFLMDHHHTIFVLWVGVGGQWERYTDFLKLAFLR